jgi:hypothetical protein
MPGRVLYHTSPVRPSKSLVARAGLARTFGGLASFLAVTFLCAGIYLLEDAFANPIAAQAAALIAAAFIIALGTILLYYLISPGKKPGPSVQKRPQRPVSLPKPQFFEEVPIAARQDNGRTDLAYQRIYVDHSRIRP